ncbi:MAG: response regulator transcription factor [Candidatus Rokubacteria bacterium]|nr:response regulator transcription factor [Candidatus Rokubacteria bacterium]
MLRRTTIIVADDHPVVREGVRTLLAREADLAVVGEEGDGLKVVELVERLRPNVLVLDLMLPGLNGLEVVRQVSKRSPHTRTVILSMHASEAYVLEALRNGAAAYVLKDSGGAELVKAVRDVVAGRRYLSAPLSDRAIDAYLERATNSPLDLYETLTTREREVLQLAAEGSSAAQIGARLSISARTAETHRANLMRKLGLQSQSELIRYAMRQGLLPRDV